MALESKPGAQAGGQIQLLHHPPVLLQRLLVCGWLCAAAHQLQICIDDLHTNPGVQLLNRCCFP